MSTEGPSGDLQGPGLSSAVHLGPTRLASTTGSRPALSSQTGPLLPPLMSPPNLHTHPAPARVCHLNQPQKGVPAPHWPSCSPGALPRVTYVWGHDSVLPALEQGPEDALHRAHFWALGYSPVTTSRGQPVRAECTNPRVKVSISTLILTGFLILLHNGPRSQNLSLCAADTWAGS